MKQTRVFWLIAVLLLGQALLFWQPWRGGPGQADLPDVGATVRLAQGQAADQKNYTFDTDVAVGEQINIASLTRVIPTDRERMAEFTWNVPQMTGEGAIYTRGELFYVFHPLKKKWLAREEDATLEPFIDFFWAQLSLGDPVENLLNIDPRNRNISFLQDGAVPDEFAGGNERKTVALQVIPDEEALSELRKSLPPQLVGAELQDLKQFFWLSPATWLVERYEVRARVSFFGLKGMDFLVVAKPHHYNQTKITLPAELNAKLPKE